MNETKLTTVIQGIFEDTISATGYGDLIRTVIDDQISHVVRLVCEIMIPQVMLKHEVRIYPTVDGYKSIGISPGTFIRLTGMSCGGFNYFPETNEVTMDIALKGRKTLIAVPLKDIFDVIVILPGDIEKSLFYMGALQLYPHAEQSDLIYRRLMSTVLNNHMVNSEFEPPVPIASTVVSNVTKVVGNVTTVDFRRK